MGLVPVIIHLNYNLLIISTDKVSRTIYSQRHILEIEVRSRKSGYHFVLISIFDATIKISVPTFRQSTFLMFVGSYSWCILNTQTHEQAPLSLRPIDSEETIRLHFLRC